MRTILLLLLLTLFLLLLLFILGRLITAYKFKIKSKNGIQKTHSIPINGIEQYLQIRGENLANPIILMIHGGPGSNSASYSYDWQKALEKNYTIVHYDQRGSGNTYYHNPKTDKPTLDLLLSDLDRTVDYLRTEYNKEKVIIMGHSWGTLLGNTYSKNHPSKVAAFISIGQMIDFKKSELLSGNEAARLAKKAGHAEDAIKLEKMLASVMSYRELDSTNAKALMNFRQLKEKYLPVQYGNKMALLYLFSPYMTFYHFKWMLGFQSLVESNDLIYKELLSDNVNMSSSHSVPIILVTGENDWTTPYELIKTYFDGLSAPAKEFIPISNTGHIPFVDNSAEFTQSLLKSLNKLVLD